ncbi:MAG TPA: 5-formyltetrahydrofolate cyclo-ligase [Ilumatobacteraceae bacterium]|nr:5-formyltetrahydrofolate cyclo-ligase [Ilumatobacteraceae bacterium]
MTDRTAPAPQPESKSVLRGAMRELRRSLSDRADRSEELWRHVTALPEVAVAETLLVFDTVPGEPETRSLLVWCAATGRLAAAPEADVDPGWPDVVIVPGLAFTKGGDRLGQGGGWYDRFLSEVRADCSSIGVCFAEQVVDVLPVEPHDVTMDVVVTDRGVLR